MRIPHLAFLLVFLGIAPAAGGLLWREGPRVDPITVVKLHEVIESERGNVVLVNVWATWCKWCKEEMPGILKLQKNSPGLKLILVSADEPDSLDSYVKPELRKLGVTFPSYIMADSTDAAFIAGMSPSWNGALPTSFLYDREGTLAKMLVGERTLKDFEKELAILLK